MSRSTSNFTNPGDERAQELSATTYGELRALARTKLARLRPALKRLLNQLRNVA